MSDLAILLIAIICGLAFIAVCIFWVRSSRREEARWRKYFRSHGHCGEQGAEQARAFEARWKAAK